MITIIKKGLFYIVKENNKIIYKSQNKDKAYNLYHAKQLQRIKSEERKDRFHY